jgi:hypothetical protein
MRWYILRTLLEKEALRHLADRGGIFLALLLIAATLILSFFGRGEAQAADLGGGAVRECYVDYWDRQCEWIAHLRRNRPAGLKIRFRHVSQVDVDERGVIYYPQSTGAIQVRTDGENEHGRTRFRVMYWHPGKDPAVLAPYAEWFWSETLRFHRRAPLILEAPSGLPVFAVDRALLEIAPVNAKEELDRAAWKRFTFWPVDGERANVLEDLVRQTDQPPIEIVVEHEELTGRADERSMMATGLVVFALCFFCVYLLPALTCEERERGILLAQMLSPASALELLAAKFLFYPAMGIALAAVLAGIYKPPVLLSPFFWTCVLATSIAYLGVGLSIASIARTQRMASMGAMCYMLTIALLLFVTQRFGVPSFQYVALEFYCPRVLHAALDGHIAFEHRMSLVAVVVLAIIWTTAATVLFRRRGWQ